MQIVIYSRGRSLEGQGLGGGSQNTIESYEKIIILKYNILYNITYSN